MNVCDAFEKWVIKGQVEYTSALEKSLTLAKEVEPGRDKFDYLERQWCALETHNMSIEHGKRDCLVCPKPLFSFENGLDSNN